MWEVIRIQWPATGSVHNGWREEVFATAPTVAEARAITAANNVPGNGYCWEVRYRKPGNRWEPAKEGQS